MLYAASNVGSMLALLAYPLVVERFLPLAQSRLWAWGYGFLVLLVVGCALRCGARARPTGARRPGRADDGREPATPTKREPSRGPVRAWVVLAAVPSSLMLSVTTYLSTDIAAIPLLWIVPLALYLLTFALVFGRRRIVPHRGWVDLLPVALLPLVLVLVARANEPLVLVIGTHLAASSWRRWSATASSRRTGPIRAPDDVYLWMAVGGRSAARSRRSSRRACSATSSSTRWSWCCSPPAGSGPPRPGRGRGDRSSTWCCPWRSGA